MATLRRVAVAVVLAFGLALPVFAAPAPHVTISLDATEAPRKIFHAHLTIPASPGTLTLYYPKWIRGEHGPTGPIQDLAGLKFTANGQLLKWRRDLLDGWTIHVEVPGGATNIEASLDFISPAGHEGIYTGGASATDKMTVISWNTVLLYPAGWSSDQLTYDASLRLPRGWNFGTSLQVASKSESEIKFAPVSLTMLVDSPIISGQYLEVVPLNQGENPPVEMDIAADTAAALEAPAEVWDHYKNLVAQAGTLFGARHYRDYHFLFSLSDHVAHFGLEHHESNDSRSYERTLVDDRLRLIEAGLLPHEYVHSWNGKYRRPADLTTPDYEKPMQTDWLWADVIIRQQTQNKKSMDDFCHLFHGGQSGPPQVKTYNFDDVVNTLNQVAPYDWHGFWTERLNNHGPGAPLAGVEGSGWKLVYDENRSELVKAEEDAAKEIINAAYSIGLWLRDDGHITDTIEGMPAAKAGIGPGMAVIAVDGKKFSVDVLHDALRATKNSSEPLELLVENTDYYKVFKIDYHGGEKFPHLVRDESKPDLLSDIIKAH